MRHTTDDAPMRSEDALTADGSTPDLPDGDQHHDELSNTDPAHHVAVTSAPVHEDVPQGVGFDGPGPELGGAEDAPPADPLPKADGQVEDADDEPAVPSAPDVEQADATPEQGKAKAAASTTRKRTAPRKR